MSSTFQSRPRRSSNRRAFHSRPNNNFRSSRTKRGGLKKDYIHPSKFVQAAQPVEQEQVIIENNFADFALHSSLQINLMAHNFVTPTPIQDKTMAEGLAGRDIIGLANTGTGKTIAFAVPILNRVITDRHSRALIIAPTRELAEQIEQECRKLAAGSGIFGTLLIGGANIRPQLRDLQRKPQVVIGTPGRIKDHLERHSLDLSKFNLIALDEVDRMLDMGFIGDITHILSGMSANKQSFYFSATLNSKVKKLIDEFSPDTVTISVVSGNTSKNVEQNVVYHTHAGEKMSKLVDLLEDEQVSKVIIFDDTQRSVDRICDELQRRNIKAASIHGGKDQRKRQRIMKAFKNDETNILVATDVAARGLDVNDVSHVINYSTPSTFDDYIHRIGRAGRAGKAGYALTFVTQ